MQKFVITTENTTDLPKDYYEKHDVEYLYLPCTMDGIVYNKQNDIPYKEFYDRMREGSMPTTSQINSEDAKEAWRPFIEDGREILHLAFSSGLSGSCNSAFIAANEMREEYPDCKIIVIDSLCASLGQGLFLDKAVQLRNEGKSLEETARWMEEHKLNMVHLVTVDDLNHLHRGGRVSKVSAVLGTMINIKPIIHVNNEGKLIPVNKVRGRKRSLTTLVDMMADQIKGYEDKNSSIFLSHSDCEEDARFVAKLVEERFGYKDFLINSIGSTIGAHTGPGTVALFFWGSHR